MSVVEKVRNKLLVSVSCKKAVVANSKAYTYVTEEANEALTALLLPGHLSNRSLMEMANTLRDAHIDKIDCLIKKVDKYEELTVNSFRLKFENYLCMTGLTALNIRLALNDYIMKHPSFPEEEVLNFIRENTTCNYYQNVRDLCFFINTHKDLKGLSPTEYIAWVVYKYNTLFKMLTNKDRFTYDIEEEILNNI